MKFILIFIIFSFSKSYSQELNIEKLVYEKLQSYNKEFPSWRNYCLLNEKDSVNREADWADTIPHLKYISKERITPEQKAQKYKSILNCGLIWYLADNFNSSVISNDYDFKVSIRFNVNCRGKIYKVNFKNESQMTRSQYCLDEFYKFSDEILRVLKSLNEKTLTPPYYKSEKNMNYAGYTIELFSKKGELYIYDRENSNTYTFNKKAD